MRFHLIVLCVMMLMESAYADTHSEYSKLQNALITYQKLAQHEQWVRIRSGATLKPGMSDTRIPALRIRLAQQQLYNAENSSIVYDEGLTEAVKRFQKMHGIDADGVIGSKTLVALNVPLAARIHQMALNIDRLKQVEGNLGERYIRINVPAFELHAIEYGKELLNMKIIVGKNSRKTPVFSSIITNVIFHPYWHVPLTIARDKLPAIKKDPSYLTRHGYVLLDHYGNRISSHSVNWKAINHHYFPYILRQNPGPGNALGTIRFSILNNMDIYMHGTPDQRLFSQASRAKSSGCIRVEYPLQLAHFVLGDVPEWSPQRIEDTYHHKHRTEKALLPSPLAVHILYLTSWVDLHGQLQFREDIYGLDALPR